MTLTPSTIPDEKVNSQTRDNFFNRLQKLFATRVVETVSISLLLSFLALSASSWNIWSIYRGFKLAIAEELELKDLSNRTIYLDEVLTMSAYMAVSSGDLRWVERYKKYEPELTEAIDKVIRISPEAKANFDKTKIANDTLVDYETRSFELLSQGKKQQANQLLFGTDYAANKAIYAQGVQNTLAQIQARVNNQLQTYENRLYWSVVLAGVTFILLILVWFIIVYSVKTYIKERDRMQQFLLNSQTSLQESNTILEQRSQQLEMQTEKLKVLEKATRQESEILQTDVGQLLDVVSAVEDGDLTIQASVNDRVTGLVSDTFNRLVEQLAQVLTQVSNTAEQVTQNSQQLDESAKTVSFNVEQQAHEITEVLTLTEQVQRAARNSADRIEQANQSLAEVRNSTEQGQLAINGLTKGIQTLQIGASQIVTRTQDLDEFVNLTNQFVQEQSQLAELIQSLAMGATLLSARATAQQDPRQMMVLAKEFDTIAKQIKGLAEQTNQNLRFLRKRSDKIQGTVTSIAQSLQEIDGLVGNFTLEVQNSTQAFSSIQSSTETALVTGETISQSSQEIVKTAQVTAKAMGAIARLADQTAQLTQTARSQSEQMGQISEQLLERIQFFRLPVKTIEQVERSHEAKESTIDVIPTTATT
jgi:methyl-accepting chemotaxis protein PixJ